MALTTLDKINLKGLLKKIHMSKINYVILYSNCSKNIFIDSDLIEFFVCEIEKRFLDNPNVIDKNICKYVSCISAIIVHNFENEKNLSESILNKAHTALNLCAENIEYCSGDEKSYLLCVMNTLNSKLIDYSMLDRSLFEKSNEEANKCLKAIMDDNTSENKAYKKEISSLKKALKSATDEISEKCSTISLLESKNCELQGNIRVLEEQIVTLNTFIDEYRSKLELVSSNTSTLDEVDVEALNSKIELLTKTVEMKDRLVSMYVGRENKDKYYKSVEERIIHVLCGRGYTFDELYKFLRNDGFSINEQELKDILIDLGKRVQITNPFNITYPLVYKISSPYVKKNKSFEFNVGDKDSLDVLVVSDLHMNKVDSLRRYVINSIYEYCSKIGINLILDLGDFTDYSNNEDARYKGYDYSSRVLERMIEDFPYDKNIVHALLGGNHDYNLLSYGVDFVDSLAKARADFVNLGYEHASVNFSPKSKIMLHHMDIKVADSFGKDEYKVDDLIYKIKSYYKINNLNRSDYYIDLLGHFHKSSLDLVNGIGLVPSLFKDRVFDGAWHLRLYFNADKSIKHIVVIPLIRNDKKLVPNGEINYQRLNLKK